MQLLLFAVISDKWCPVCLLTAPSRRMTRWFGVPPPCFQRTLLHLDTDVNVGKPHRWVHIFSECLGLLMHADFYLPFTSRVLSVVSYFPLLCRKCRAFQSNWNLLWLLLCISECHSAAVFVYTDFLFCCQTIDRRFKSTAENKMLICLLVYRCLHFMFPELVWSQNIMFIILKSSLLVSLHYWPAASSDQYCYNITVCRQCTKLYTLWWTIMKYKW